MDKKYKVAILHPSLILGGAEQLIVNLAVALQNKGYGVKIFTGFHDKRAAFPETIDGTLNVEVRGGFVPPTFLGLFRLILSTFQMFIVTLAAIFSPEKFDLFVVDQNCFVLPLLWLFRKKTIFYLHFPEKLLYTDRSNPLKKVYRFFLDYIEEFCLLFANKIVANSIFTRSSFENTFSGLRRLGKNTEVLYPAIDVTKFKKVGAKGKSTLTKFGLGDAPFFLSLNRFEGTKNITLAVKAFAIFRKKHARENCKLVIAGGFNAASKWNVQAFQELTQLVEAEGLGDKVVFCKNVSQPERLELLEKCICLLYTPLNEHFGIVPLEVMYMEKPVIAHNSGGPKESVSSSAGFLLENDPAQWADKMDFLFSNPKEVELMGGKAKENVEKRFAFDVFTDVVDRIVKDVLGAGANAQARKTK